jgi:hypothetical protein
MDFESRSNEHIEMLTHQLRETFTQFAAETLLNGEKLTKLLHEAGVDTVINIDDPHMNSYELTDETGEFMLANADKLGLGDCLTLLEALGAEVQLIVQIPADSRKKLLTPRQQHRLQVAEHLADLPRKLRRPR